MKGFPYAGALAFTLFAGFLLPAYGDGGCEKADLVSGRAFVNRALAAERNGNYLVAMAEIRRVPACAPDVNFEQLATLRLHVARRLGEQEEKGGRFKDAAAWFQEADRPVDVDRVMDEWGKSASHDPDVFEKVYRYFENGRPNPARLAELRRIAVRNADEELANEDKAFTRFRDTTDLLDKARHWLRYVEGGEMKVMERAVLRGDTLAKQESPGTFESALTYYRYAEDQQREALLRDRALGLAEAHERQGESALAIQYYEIGGRRDKADVLRKQTRTQMQKDERARKKKFATDQKALEKELGF
jgi:tetratricopeptide (TPR) repeat protein